MKEQRTFYFDVKTETERRKSHFITQEQAELGLKVLAVEIWNSN
jgi:hypothetical protein